MAARRGGDVTIAAGALVELQACVGVDFGQRLLECDSPQRNAKIRGQNPPAYYHLVRVRPADWGTPHGSRSHSRIIRKKGLAETERYGRQQEVVRREQAQCGLWRIQAHPLVE